MICPHCGKSGRDEDLLPLCALHNAERYLSPLAIASLCCGRPLRIHPRIILDIRAFTPHEGENTDDWGTEYK